MGLSEQAVASVKKHIGEIPKNSREVVEAQLGYRKAVRSGSKRLSRVQQRHMRAVSMNRRAVKGVRGLAIAHYSAMKGKKFESLKNHSRTFLNAVVEMVSLHGEDVNALRILEAAPAITSTAIGNFAITVVSALSENATAFPNFLDLEIVEGVPVFYFTKPANGSKVKDEAFVVFEKFGKPEVIVNYGDAVSETTKSEILAIALVVDEAGVEKNTDESIAAIATAEAAEVAEAIEAVEGETVVEDEEDDEDLEDDLEEDDEDVELEDDLDADLEEEEDDEDLEDDLDLELEDMEEDEDDEDLEDDLEDDESDDEA